MKHELPNRLTNSGTMKRDITYHLVSVPVLLVVCSALCYFLLFFPIPRQIGLTFRNTLYVFPIIFLASLAFCITKRRWLRLLLTGVLFAFVLLPYSGLLNSGLSDQYALGGIIPWSDGFTMQLNTQRFLYGGYMGQSTAIRPLSTVFYAVFLHLFGNNYLALQIFLCCAAALGLILTTEAVNKALGSICAAMFFTLLYYYIRQRLGTYMTEPYGFLCGLLSCFWLLTGVRIKNNIFILIGFLALSIGLNARPAAMFLFPAVGLWYFLIYLKDDPHRLLRAAAGLFVMLSGFGMNRIAQTAVYGDGKIPNRQAAEMVYGLCLGGKSWGDVTGSAEMAALDTSDNVIRDVASLCMPVLKEHPENILSALKTIFIDSLIRSEFYGAFSFVSGNPKGLQTIARYGLMVIWCAGFVVLIRKRRDPLYSLLLVSVFGILLSECAAVPFSTSYLRLYAVSMWVPACVTGVFLQFLTESVFAGASVCFAQDSTSKTGMLFAGILSVLIIVCAVFGAGYIRSHPLRRPVRISGLCAEDEDILITSVDPGSFIYLQEQADLQNEHYPYFRLPYVRQHIHDTASVEMFPFTDSIDSPTAIIRGIDLENLADALVFSPLDLVENKTGYAQFCGHFIEPPVLRNDRFFIPTSVSFYEDGL